MVNHTQEILDLDDIKREVNIENQAVDIEIRNMVGHQTKNMDDRQTGDIEKNIKSCKYI